MLSHRLIYKDAHGREPCIVMGVSVCFYVSVYVFVCLSVRENVSGSARPILVVKFFGHATCGRGSVLFWRRSDTLCTLSVIFPHNGQE